MKWEYKHSIALIYAIVLFLDRLDLTVVNVTLPTVAEYFHISIAATDWVNIAFLLALAISIPISSWLGHRFGLKKIYLFAMLLFGLSSTLCVWAPSLFSINILRFIQGLGGGLLIPVGMTMLYQIYEPSEYASITSFTFLPSLIAPAIAPFLGGIILIFFGWRTVFLFSGPIVLALVCYAAMAIKPDEIASEMKRLDWFGLLLTSTLLIDIFLTLSAIGRSGFSFAILIGVISFLILLGLFIHWQKKCSYALFDLKLFNNKNFISANLIQICFQVVHFGAIFLIGMYLQVGIGMSAVFAGLIMGMQAVGAMAISRYSVKLYHQYGAKKIIAWGLGGVAVITPAILLISQPNMIWLGISLFFVRGLFSGLCGTPIQTLSVTGFSKHQLPQVNSIFNTCRQVAISLGIALSSIMISWGLKLNALDSHHIANYSLALHVFSWGFVMLTGAALLGVYVIITSSSSQ